MQLSVFADKNTKFPNCGTKDYFLLLINCDLRSVSLKLSFVRSIPTQSTAPNSVLWYGLMAALSQPLIHQLSDVVYPNGVTREGLTVLRPGWHINTQCCTRNSNSINLELNNDLNTVVSCFPVCRSRLKYIAIALGIRVKWIAIAAIDMMMMFKAIVLLHLRFGIQILQLNAVLLPRIGIEKSLYYFKYS